MADLLKKISDLTSGTPLDTDIVPYVDLVTNTTKKALKSELKGDKGDTGTAATVDAGTTTTLAAGESATVTNIGTTSAAIFNFAIPQGIQGVAGATGAKVTSVAFSGNDIVFTLDDSSTVTLTNAKIDLKGDKGDKGIQGIQGVQGDKGDKGDTGNTGLTGDKGDKGDTGAKITSAGFSSNDLVFNLDDSSSVTISNAKTDLKGDKGDKGDTGAKGDQGIQGIQGITGNTGAKGDTGAKITSASFVSDDLVFTLDDSSTVTITGAKTTLKGDKGDKGDKGEKGDQGTIGLTGDKGDKGDKGDTGLTGPKGDKGDTGNNGIDGTSFTWKGAYAGGTAYVKNDNVSYNGSSYIAKSNTTGNLPTDATYWDLLAEKGADGIGAGDMLASVYDTDGGAKQVAFKDQLHNAVTVTDTAEIDMTLTGQDIKADIKTASVAKSKLDSGVQASLEKADSAIQDISGKEDVSNKKTSLADNSDTFYPTQKAVKTAVDAKQDTLAFTPEDSANKENTTINTSTTKYPTVNLLKTVKDIADAKMSNPMSATGDIIYGGASGVATRLAKGDDNKVLMLKSGLPSWETPASGGADIIEVQMFS